MTTFHRSLDAALARQQQEDPMPPCDADGNEDFPEHDCHVEAVEEATHPAYSGAFTVTTTCGVCGRHLATLHDSIL